MEGAHVTIGSSDDDLMSSDVDNNERLTRIARKVRAQLSEDGGVEMGVSFAGAAIVSAMIRLDIVQDDVHGVGVGNQLLGAHLLEGEQLTFNNSADLYQFVSSKFIGDHLSLQSSRSKSMTVDEMNVDAGLALAEIRLTLQMIDLERGRKLHQLVKKLATMSVIFSHGTNEKLKDELQALMSTVQERVAENSRCCDLGVQRIREVVKNAEDVMEHSAIVRSRTVPLSEDMGPSESAILDGDITVGVSASADIQVKEVEMEQPRIDENLRQSTTTASEVDTGGGASNGKKEAMKQKSCRFAVTEPSGDEAERRRNRRLMRRQQKMVDVLETMRDAEKAREAIKDFGEHSVKLVRMRSERLVARNETKIFSMPHLLSKPRLRQYWLSDETVLVREDKEHKVSWNELFFDLVFVAIFSDLGHTLQANTTRRGVAEFLIVFFSAWSVWSVCNTYINRFDPSDAFHKLFYFTEMLFLMSIVVHGPRGLILSFMCARIIPNLLSEWSARYERRARKVVTAEHVVLCIALIPWIVAYAIDPTYSSTHRSDEHLVLWSIGLFLDTVGRILIECIKGLRVPLNIEHLTERIGLLTIIMLGEQIISLLFKRAEATRTTYVGSICAGVVVLTFQIFYFDVDGGVQKQHALFRSDNKGVWPILWYNAHMLLHAAITMGAAATNNLIEDTFKDPGSTNSHVSGVFASNTGGGAADDDLSFDKWLYGISQCITFCMLATIGWSHLSLTTYVDKRIRIGFRVMIAVIMISMPVSSLSAVGMLGVSAMLSAIAGVVELYGGVVPRKKVHKENPALPELSYPTRSNLGGTVANES